jgi:chaperonin GroEL
VSVLGTCKKLTISKDDTIMLDGAGGKEAIDERCELLRETIADTSSEYEKEKLQERLAKLSGGVAVIKVGGATETEVSEKKDRVTDALNATRAAVEEGIVAGGGTALLYATQALKDLPVSNNDQKYGVEIMVQALTVPCKTIAANAGAEGAVVVGKLLESTDPNYGFDAQNGEYVDLVAKGIIDPTKVVRTALVDAASIASLMTTTEAMVVELPTKDAPAPGGGMGGMGGSTRARRTSSPRTSSAAQPARTATTRAPLLSHCAARLAPSQWVAWAAWTFRACWLWRNSFVRLRRACAAATLDGGPTALLSLGGGAIR